MRLLQFLQGLEIKLRLDASGMAGEGRAIRCVVVGKAEAAEDKAVIRVVEGTGIVVAPHLTATDIAGEGRVGHLFPFAADCANPLVFEEDASVVDGIARIEVFEEGIGSCVMDGDFRTP